jgi:hypothetical protein
VNGDEIKQAIKSEHLLNILAQEEVMTNIQPNPYILACGSLLRRPIMKI